MFKWLSRLFRSDAALRKIVAEINALEAEVKEFSNERLLEDSNSLRRLIQEQKLTLDEAVPRAFALVRETAKRTLGQRHFDVQLMGGIVLHQGKIAEMRTGEGKTLAATAPAYLNALSGKGAHLVTVNEYLAKRDTVWMGQIYHALGLKVACLVHEGAKIYDPHFLGRHPERSEGSQDSSPSQSGAQNDKKGHQEDSALLDKERDTTGSFMIQEDYLRPISRKEAYAADITYGTNHEFGFDYLRDNLVYRLEDQVQRTPNYAIIDEVDSILIDEARTPLIISAPDTASSDYYKTFAKLVARLEEGTDYITDEKKRAADITEEGINKVEKTLNLKNIYDPENLRLTHYLQESLKAHALFKKDRDYVVKDGEIILVDQFTGRLLPGRRYSGGLHQAIEAKESLFVQNESRTYASISIQNYFRMYPKLAGMTGTAQTSAEEFHKVYGLEAVTIPPNREMIRKDLPDLIYKTMEGKFNAVVEEIKKRQEKGQPVLVGTVSIERNEFLSKLLNRAGISHEVLNAKNNEREGAIIAQAGKLGGVTIATNMAGRGVDIIPGGNPGDPEQRRRVLDASGLHVIGTERHESRRIDNQLRGRAGRQGDLGSSQFFLSLEDDLMRIFGGEKIKSMMEWLKVPEDMPISAGAVTRAVGQAQARVEGLNFDARKHLLDYDDVLNKQRKAIYGKRQEILKTGNVSLRAEAKQSYNNDNVRSPRSDESVGTRDDKMSLSGSARAQALQILDFLWMSHLENMEALAESVRLRAYAQHDPLVEYRREGHLLYQQMLSDFDSWTKENIGKLSSTKSESETNQRIEDTSKPFVNSQSNSFFVDGKVGRNDPCPCGAKKQDGHPIKYKHCHGKNV